MLVTVRALPLLATVLVASGCRNYVPVNLPLEQLAMAPPAGGARPVNEGRPATIPVPGGDKFRVTMNDGCRFVVSSLIMSRDSLIGLVGGDPTPNAYAPPGPATVTPSTYGGRISVPLYEVRVVEEEKLDFLSTASLLVAPLTLALLLTH